MFLQREMEVGALSKKIVLDYTILQGKVLALKLIEPEVRVVLTIGSWDMLHIGHARYLMNAKRRGDILIVGVDSDRAIKLYKGPKRPVITETERREMLMYLTFVDFITSVDDVDEKGKWQYGLLRTIQPDVFVAVEDSYPDEQRREIEKRCGELIVLPRQAKNTSSTEIFEKVVKGRTKKPQRRR